MIGNVYPVRFPAGTACEQCGTAIPSHAQAFVVSQTGIACKEKCAEDLAYGVPRHASAQAVVHG